MRKTKGENKGITLIALVITIIILLILAGITISAVIGRNGITSKAKDAETETRAGEVQEIIDLWKTEISASNFHSDWGDALTEDEMLEKLIKDGKVKEREINRTDKIIKIGSKEIDYSVANIGNPLGKGAYAILYGCGEYTDSDSIVPSSLVVEENEYSDLVYFTETPEIITLANNYYYDYYVLVFNTTGKVEEDATRKYVGTVDCSVETVAQKYDDDYTLLNRIDEVIFEEKVAPKYISFKCFNDVNFVNFGNLNTSNCTSMEFMFCNVNPSSYLDLSTFNTSNATNMSYMFARINIDDFNISNLDTSNVTDMSYMFSGSTGEKIDLQSFDTSNVTDMSYMFSGSHFLEEINVSSFDTSNVTDMSHMFSQLMIEKIDLQSFDTSNVTDMSCMFSESHFLEEINVSSFDTSNVTNMSHLFYCTDNLKNINLDGWDTQNVTNMEKMFYSCWECESLDLSGFDTRNVVNFNLMLSACPKTTVYIGDNWNSTMTETATGYSKTFTKK